MKFLTEHVSEDLTRVCSIYVFTVDGKSINSKKTKTSLLLIATDENGNKQQFPFETSLEAEKFAEEWVSKND